MTATTAAGTRVSVLGLGAMGQALATALVRDGLPVTVWNRTPGRSGALEQAGAATAPTARDAVAASDVVVVCLLDHGSVHAVLDPLTADLAGRTVVNVTTTSPEGARELAAWAAGAGAAYVDGGIMAVPDMIGDPGASVLCSGSAEAFTACRHVLDRWGETVWLGDDAGTASLYDLALLAGIYVMFAGFLHGAAMVAGAGITAGEFAERAAPWLGAMTGGLAEYAAVVDGGDYGVAGQQSLEFSDLGDILAASRAQGIGTEVVDVVQRLVRRQVEAGHGTEGFARIYESIRGPEAA